jgi:hypothetical protein
LFELGGDRVCHSGGWFISFTVIVKLVLAETKDFLTDSDIQGDLKVAMIHLITLFSRLQSYRIMRVITENFFKSLVANHY